MKAWNISRSCAEVMFFMVVNLPSVWKAGDGLNLRHRLL
jgi:hypothetical protein